MTKGKDKNWASCGTVSVCMLETTFDETEELNLFPHYSDPRFYKGATHTVFGERHPEKGKDWTYLYSDSDRVRSEFFDYCFQRAQNEKLGGFTAAAYSRTFSLYLGKKVKIRHIMVGVDPHGAPYSVFGFETLEEPQEKYPQSKAEKAFALELKNPERKKLAMEDNKVQRVLRSLKECTSDISDGKEKITRLEKQIDLLKKAVARREKELPKKLEMAEKAKESFEEKLQAYRTDFPYLPQFPHI